MLLSTGFRVAGLMAFCLIVCAMSQVASAQSGKRDDTASRGSGSKAGASSGVAVVELFTSQGCSSCPSADRVLTAIDQAADESGLPIFVLSMHVDYWNRLGWEDPYSTRQWSERQRQYAAAAGSRRIYTPQMMVNGTEEFVGSNAQLAQSALRSALAQPARAEVNLQVASTSASEWNVEYAVSGAAANDELVICLVADAPANHVDRGENTGRDLAHSGVVRTLQREPLGNGASGSATVAWPKAQPRSATPLSIVAFVQNAETRAITGATQWTAGG